MSVLARLSLRHRSLIGLLALLVIGFGALTLPKIKQQLFPSLQLPAAVITTAYAGASPDTVDQQVTQPLEGGLQGLQGLKELDSTSSQGSSSIVAQFEFGTDIDAAVNQMQQVVNRVRTRLPDNSDPAVTAGRTDDIPVVLLAAATTGDTGQLATRLNDDVAPQLRKIDGVRTVTVTGARTPTITVALDYAKLAAAGVDPTSVATTLQNAGAAIPAGTLDADGKTLTVQVGGGTSTVDTIRDLYLTPSATGRPGAAAAKPVRLGDVADVQAGFAPPTSITRTNGKPSLGLSVTMVDNGNAPAVSKAVQDALPDLGTKAGAELSVVFDQGPAVSDAIHGLTVEGLLGLAFAVVVILLFLLSLRSTLVTAVSIPLSVVVALLALWSGDLSLNLLTLGALTIAIGRVVDDSIVVLENIKRHLGYGEDKQRAVLDGVREVAGAVTASTLTTVAVFLPIAFVTGIVGELFSPFAVTVTVALLASLLVSLTVVPVLAYWFLKPPKNAEDAERTRLEAEKKERRSLLQRAYLPVIRFATRRRWVVVGLALLIFAATGALAAGLKTNFLGSAGGTSLSISQQLPPGASIDARQKAAATVESALAAEPSVKTYQVSVGGGGAAAQFGFGGGNTATSISVTVAKGTDLDTLSDKLRDELTTKPGIGTIKVGQQDQGLNSDQVSVVVTAPTEAALEPAAGQVQQALSGVSGLTEVTSDLAQGSPQVRIDVDGAEAAAHGLSAAAVGQVANQALAGRTVAQLPVAGQQTDVVLRAGTAPASVDDVKALPIPGPGGVVRLDQVAKVSTVDGPAAVKRTGGDLSTTVTAKNTGTDLSKVTSDMTAKLSALKLSGGASYTIGGVSQEQKDAFQNLFLALLAAIAIVFLIMVATFRSLIQPLILLVSIPFAATGALGLMLATGTALGLPSLIGMLMLVGIVVTNAIVLIDLINQYRGQGMSISDAVAEGGRRRLRPILMTACATVFALVPMALGLTGQGAFIGQPLAIVVIGGLVSSTLLTLVLVPTLYTMAESFKERRRTRRAARRTPAEAPAESPEALDPTPAP